MFTHLLTAWGYSEMGVVMVGVVYDFTFHSE